MYCIQEMDEREHSHSSDMHAPNTKLHVAPGKGTQVAKALHAHSMFRLARATTLAARLQVNRDGLGEVGIEIAHFLLRQSLPRDDFERLLYVDSLFRTRLEVWNAAFGLAVGHGTLLRDLHSISWL